MENREMEKAVSELIKADNGNVENEGLYRFLIGLLFCGDNFKKAMEFSKASKKRCSEWYKNLANNGYFQDGKIVMGQSFPDKDSDIEIYLMAAVAMGWIARSLESNKK